MAELKAEPHEVAIVVDPLYGAKLVALSRRMHVWVCDSAENRVAVTQVLTLPPAASLDRGITTFKTLPDATPEQSCRDILDQMGRPGPKKTQEYGVEIAQSPTEEHDMTERKVCLITGAGRGLGVDLAKAVLSAGHAAVATGRDAAKVAAAVGDHDNLLAFTLDVTRPQDAQAAVGAAVAKFGRIDVLVNNAGNFFAGFFEELSSEQVRHQIETLLFGPMNVTRAVLPVMRKQRSGLVVTVSSTAGIAGQMFCSAYAAAKFGIEGWMESLTTEIAPFGIRTMLVEPGFFRTELLSNHSTTFAKSSIDDYAGKTREIVAAWKSMDGKQGGDPTRLADAIVRLVALEEPPSRFAAGADAMQTFETKANTLLTQARAHRELSASLAFEGA